MDRAAGGRFESPVIRWLIDMNFLHYAILMFVICSLVLIGVSLMTPAPERKKLAGLTFATVDDKMAVTPVRTIEYKPAAETAMEHRVNIVFSLGLFCTVVGLWVYFR
jgi:SSS family solute:Na+ symporter